MDARTKLLEQYGKCSVAAFRGHFCTLESTNDPHLDTIESVITERSLKKDPSRASDYGILSKRRELHSKHAWRRIQIKGSEEKILQANTVSQPMINGAVQLTKPLPSLVNRSLESTR